MATVTVPPGILHAGNRGLCLDGITPTSEIEHTAEMPVGSASLSGVAPTLAFGVSIPEGSQALSGAAPTANVGGDISIEVPVGSLSVASDAPSAEITHIREVPVAALSLSGGAPSVTFTSIRAPPAGSLSLAAAAPSGEITHIRQVPELGLSLTAAAPSASLLTSARAFRIGDWSNREPTEPTGNITPKSGDNRLLIVAVLSQFEGGYSVTSFEIGGQSYDYTETSQLDKTASTQDTQVTYFIWDEASIAAMSGAAVSYTGDTASTPNSLIFYSYATFGDVDQTSPYTTDAATSQSSDTLALTTTSTDVDYIITGVSRSSVSRDVTDWDTLTEVFDAGGEGFRQALADGSGGDATTTLTGDGTADDFNALALVLKSAFSTPIEVPIGSVSCSGAAPSAEITHVAEMPAGSLTLSPSTPAPNPFEEPGTVSLSITGVAPSAVVATSDLDIFPPRGQIELNRTAPIVATAIGGQAGSVSLSGKIPRRGHGLQLSGNAPTLSITSPSGPIPGQASLSLTGETPSVNRLISTPIGSLSCQGFAPSVNFGDTLGFAQPGTGSLSFTTTDAEFDNSGDMRIVIEGAAPDLLVNDINSVPAGSLSLTGRIPAAVVAPSGSLPVVPDTGGISVSGIAATILNPTDPATATIVINGRIPSAVVEGTSSVRSPGEDTLLLQGAAPTVVVTSTVPVGSVAITGKIPVAIQPTFGDRISAPDFGIVEIKGFAPTVPTDIIKKPQTASLTITEGLTDAVPARWSGAIGGAENPDATTDVPSHYEICDRTGFRVPAGTLVREWDGTMVRPQSFEPRHPQDFVRSRPDRQDGSERPEQEDQFIEDLYPDGVSSDDL